MDWVKILYWISVVVLWVLIGLNFWNLGRTRRLRKDWEKMIKELKLITRHQETMRDKYIEMIIEQRGEISDEGKDCN